MNVAVVVGFFYTGVKLNQDQGYWPLLAVVEGWPLREVPLYVIRWLLLTIGVPISLKRAPSRIGT